MIKLLAFVAATAVTPALAQPAFPLIVHDPYLSVWSMRDQLTQDWPRHWTGTAMGMSGLVRVDGAAFRWCGPMPQNVPAAEQVSVEVGLTSTTYTMKAGPVELTIAFASSLSDLTDLALASESISSISFAARSLDGQTHSVQTYVDLTGEWCTHDSGDLVHWSRHAVEGLEVLSIGSVDQPVLKASGDARRIDWGRAYIAAQKGVAATTSTGGHDQSRRHFISSGQGLASDDLRSPRRVNEEWPVLAVSLDLGSVAKEATPPQHVLVGYDEGRAIELHERALRPLWHRVNGSNFADRLIAAKARLDSADSNTAAKAANASFTQTAERVGGPQYAKLLTLGYRQVLGGHKIVADWDGTPLMFSKENTSNGCLATVDVIYPACPFFLYHNPEMLKAQLLPLLQYASSSRWTFPFAPHDLGTYPKANGQVYGGGEKSEENQMPVEESGNMIIMLAALAKVEGNADFSKPYLDMLERWAVYLKDNGLDPVHQLCTDDFAGHLARNVNLSAKTCVALGAYAQLLNTAGKTEQAAKWRTIAESYSKQWVTMATGPSATVLVFSESATATSQDTWSQKYNLIWDRVLGLNLFADEIYEREMAWYLSKLNRYGLPLDSRKAYTKLDWSVWSACLTQNRKDFDAIMKPTYDWAWASPPPSRVPLSDWYQTTDGTTMGMHTRTVVGGMWMPLLMDKLEVGLR